MPPADRYRSRNTRLRTDTNCSGNGLRDKLAHRVMLQAPQPRLHSSLREAQRQPGADWARTQSTILETHLGELDQLLRSAIGRNTQGRSVTHQLPGTDRLLHLCRCNPNGPRQSIRPFTGQASVGNYQTCSKRKLNRLTGSLCSSLLIASLLCSTMAAPLLKRSHEINHLIRDGQQAISLPEVYLFYSSDFLHLEPARPHPPTHLCIPSQLGPLPQSRVPSGRHVTTSSAPRGWARGSRQLGVPGQLPGHRRRRVTAAHL